MTVTVTERVTLYLKEKDGKPELDELKRHFPDVKPNTLTQIRKRYLEKKPVRTNMNRGKGDKPGDNDTPADHNESLPPPRSGSAPTEATTIDETLWEKCILRLVNEASEMTPQIIDKVKDYLDKKDAIVSAKADENIQYSATELAQKAEEFLTRVYTAKHPSTALPAELSRV